MTEAKTLPMNSSFSTLLPGLQLAVDSTSLGAFKACPRSYYYSIVLGYQPRSLSVHLTFGILLHEARERYDGLRAAGAIHEDGLVAVVQQALVSTWDKALLRPWASDHKSKNRLTLIRSIVWYLDQFGESDPIQTIRLANGKSANELSFQFDSGYTTSSTGERWTFCGHLDRIGMLNDVPYVVDLKTTEWTIDGSWFARFTPDNQFSMYALAGQMAFGVPVRALIVDGLQVAAGFTRCERGLVQRDEATLQEWHFGTHRWLQAMESCAGEAEALVSRGVDPANAWPMNDKSCLQYSSGDGSRGGCQYRSVCSRTPGARAGWLKSEFIRRVWDPQQRRGDV